MAGRLMLARRCTNCSFAKKCLSTTAGDGGGAVTVFTVHFKLNQTLINSIHILSDECQ